MEWISVIVHLGQAMAWLTWCVYSWDVMEPDAYYITFANPMVFFAHLSKQIHGKVHNQGNDEMKIMMLK